MKLYHGCSFENLRSIMTTGLHPRLEKKSNWKKAPSRPDMVYLTVAYPFYFALSHKGLAAWHRGRASDDNFLPYFAGKAVGEAMKKLMQAHPQSSLLVLCGHTHSGGDIKVLDNLRVLTGKGEYGKLKTGGIRTVE
jgi:hypothetical protein